MDMFVPSYYQHYVLSESEGEMEQSDGKWWAVFGAKSVSQLTFSESGSDVCNDGLLDM